jgi:hypothetical protein
VRTVARQRAVFTTQKKKEAKQTNDSFSCFAQGEWKCKTLTNQWHISPPPDNAWKS